jgi:trehalose-phosphatase
MDYLFDKWDKLKETLVNKHIFLFLDYDGTLTPIVDYPDKAVISEEVRNLLKDLSNNPRCHVGVISGRALNDVKKIVGLKNIVYVGNHGLEIESPKIKFESQISPRLQSIIRRIKEELSNRLSKIKGLFVEDKNVTLSVHYRLATRNDYLLAKKIIEEIIQPFLVSGKIKVTNGKKVIEIKPPAQWNKGRVAEWLLARQTFILGDQPIVAIYLGDDVADEDAFKAVQNKGLTVLVGKPKKSYAQYYLKNSSEVMQFLRQLMELKKDTTIC